MTNFFLSASFLLVFVGNAQSAEIKLLSTGLFRGVLPTIASAFERTSGNKVLFSIATPGVLRDRLLKGETFDIALIPAALNIDEIIKAGILNLDTRKDIAQSSIGIAVQANSRKLDLSTVTAVKNTVSAARSVALTDPAGGAPIGLHIQNIAEKFGFASELKSRMIAIVGNGEDVAQSVAKGQADIGITLASEIASVIGVDIAGLLPAEMQLASGTAFGVVLRGSREPAATKALLDFLQTTEAKNLMRERGIDPL